MIDYYCISRDIPTALFLPPDGFPVPASCKAFRNASISSRAAFIRVACLGIGDGSGQVGNPLGNPLGLSENSVPLHPMINDHYPY